MRQIGCGGDFVTIGRPHIWDVVKIHLDDRAQCLCPLYEEHTNGIHVFRKWQRQFEKIDRVRILTCNVCAVYVMLMVHRHCLRNFDAECIKRATGHSTKILEKQTSNLPRNSMIVIVLFFFWNNKHSSLIFFTLYSLNPPASVLCENAYHVQMLLQLRLTLPDWWRVASEVDVESKRFVVLSLNIHFFFFFTPLLVAIWSCRHLTA